jgi:tetratricopeptide (TPR) repeat protein
MKLPEARKILGLKPEEDPRPYLAEFKTAREHIASMVKTASSEALTDRYQKGLTEFDEALAAIHEQLETLDQTRPPPPKKVVKENLPAPSPLAATEKLDDDPDQDAPVKSGGFLRFTAWATVVLVALGGAGWIYLQDLRAKENQRLIRIALLERQGSMMIENRRWNDATRVFFEIEKLAPGSAIALRGRRSIEAGMGEEQTQFIGYWTGQATAELEAGRLEEALSAAQKVLDRYPADPEATAILGKLDRARKDLVRTTALAKARQELDLKDWKSAIATAQSVLATTPDDPDAKSILATGTAAIEKALADQAQAVKLLQMAIARDQGRFDPEVLEWLREASSLDPTHVEIRERLEKISNYSRTIRVPGDYATPAEALAHAQDRDRIVIGEGTWKGPLVVNNHVEIQGAGFANTRVECTPEDGSAISIGPDARGVRVSGISFRHEAFAVGSDRFSVALVRGGNAAFVDCRFTEGSGHGLAVIEGGGATINRCRFADNGWNGIAAIGKGSTLEVKDSESLNNFEHGIESWDGAAVILINNRCEGNSRNGIHADNGLASVTLEGNQLIANREFGLVLNSAGSGKVSGTTAQENLLGGIVIGAAAENVAVASNQVTQNQGAGLILEKGLNPANYSSNTASKNSGQQIVSGISLSAEEEPPVKSQPKPKNRE